MEKIKVLALFTCFNRKEKTVGSINSLNQMCDAEFDFIVVDDNSTDGTQDALSKYPNVHIIQGNGSLYYSGGMRTAIEHAKSRSLSDYQYVMFMNDDVQFYEHAIAGLAQSAPDSETIMIGSMCDDQKQLSYGGVVKTSQWKPSYQTVMPCPGVLQYCDTFCGNCVLIPADVFLQLPNIDPAYHHAMGDFDYGLTAARMGFKMAASCFFVGLCNDNPREGTWKDPSLTRRERIRRKESPKGEPFKEWFHYLYKNHSISAALLYSAIPYAKILLKR